MLRLKAGKKVGNFCQFFDSDGLLLDALKVIFH